MVAQAQRSGPRCSVWPTWQPWVFYRRGHRRLASRGLGAVWRRTRVGSLVHQRSLGKLIIVHAPCALGLANPDVDQRGSDCKAATQGHPFQMRRNDRGSAPDQIRQIVDKTGT